MPTLLQINVTANWGSTGKIAEDIGRIAISQGWKSYIAYGRATNPTSSSSLIPIGNKWDMYFHGMQSRILDNHGLASKTATRNLIKKIEEIKPDIIHIHNIHGYFINYEILFEYLSSSGKPIVWTLHDCWPFTGHCAYFDMVNCEKWKNGCNECQHKSTYPASFLMSNSGQNYKKKKDSFLSLKKLTLVPVSNWLSDLLEKSFLANVNKRTIHNGIDINKFKPTQTTNQSTKTILGVASIWEKRKGLEDFIKLRELLPDEYNIRLIGLSNKQIATLPKGITGISRTNNFEELLEHYSKADVYVNPTYEDNFPTTNLEAMACGTPVITYRTGGSPESVTEQTGIVVDKGNIEQLIDAIETIFKNGKQHYSTVCREHAVKYYNKDDKFNEYIELYKSLLK